MTAKQYKKTAWAKRTALEFLDYFKKRHSDYKICIYVSLENAVARKMHKDIGFEKIKEIQHTF